MTYFFSFPVPKILLASGPRRAFGLLPTSLPIGLPVRAAYTRHAKTLGLGPAQNNLHLSFSFFDSARTGVPNPVRAVVYLNYLTPAQTKSR